MSVNWDSESKWSFVIDTDEYAGNFERQLSAYVVGACDAYGEHRAGPYLEMFKKDFPDENPFEDLIEDRVVDPGDDAIMRAPMDIAPTPGYSNDGTGEVTRLKKNKKLKYPVYNSVAIFLSRKPTAKELKLLKERAEKFPSIPPQKMWDCKFDIIGLRLVEERTVITEHYLP
jgi:hypothetical protein